MYILTSVVFVFPQVSAVCRSEIPPPNWSARSPPASVSHDSVYIPLLIGLHFTVNMLFVYRYHHHQLSHDSSVSRTFDTFTAPREPPPSPRDNLSVYASIKNWDTPQIRCFSIKPTPLFKIYQYECWIGIRFFGKSERWKNLNHKLIVDYLIPDHERLTSPDFKWFVNSLTASAK